MNQASSKSQANVVSHLGSLSMRMIPLGDLKSSFQAYTSMKLLSSHINPDCFPVSQEKDLEANNYFPHKVVLVERVLEVFIMGCLSYRR